MPKLKTSKNYKIINHKYIIVIDIENVKFPVPNFMLKSIEVYI